MRTRIQIVLLLALLVGACENYRSNFDKEIKTCEVAERNSLLATAVNACEKALDIADSRNFSSVLKSRIQYRLGRLKRQQGKYTEAEERLTQSLTLEEKQTAPISWKSADGCLSCHSAWPVRAVGRRAPNFCSVYYL